LPFPQRVDLSLTKILNRFYEVAHKWQDLWGSRISNEKGLAMALEAAAFEVLSGNDDPPSKETEVSRL
jgi:hypothetical protein